MKNRDKIKAMNDDDLALVLMCPYDTLGCKYDDLPCVKELDEAPSTTYCHGCVKEWLDKEAE